MSKIHEMYNNGTTKKLDALEKTAGMAGKLPELTEALWGSDATKENPKGIPAMTLMLSIRDGRLRWQLSAQNADKGYGGVVRDLDAILESIENSILTEDCDEWTKKGK